MQWKCDVILYMFGNSAFLYMVFAKQTLYFVLPAATAAESQHAPVCSGAEWPPDRHTTAACSGHHLTDAAGTTEYVHRMQC